MFPLIQFLLMKWEINASFKTMLTMEEEGQTDTNYEYCNHYKKVIVEHFSLNENREQLHYGKCAVIGYCISERGVYFLGNIRITSSNQNVQLPDNVHKVLLLTNLYGEAPPINTFVEIFGESALYDTTLAFSDNVTSIPSTTPLDLYRMRTVEIEINGAVDENYHSTVRRCYIPAIKVHAIIPIENPHEMVNCNLRLKQIIDKT